VRTWLLRGTLHIAAAEDVGWLLGLLGPRFAAADRGRRLQLGLDEATCAKAIRAIRAVLEASGPLTREDLVEHLGRRGVSLDPKGQDRAHLIALAALEGVICLGPGGSGGRPTYVLLEDWIGPAGPLSPDAARAQLATRYLAAYGPAGPADLAVWAGIPVREAMNAMRLVSSNLVEVNISGTRAWMLAGAREDQPEPRPASTRLLPAFDTYLLGYRSRRLAMEPQAEARVQRGGGWLHPTVAVDGWVVATWKHRLTKGRVEVSVEPFQAIDRDTRAGIDAEIADIGRFLAPAG
jgi:Winged helix DNA-binding domain